MSKTKDQSNIYDNNDFYNGYLSLPRSQHGLSHAPEFEYVKTMLPNLNGAKVADLGCGFGYFSRYVVDQGASAVLAVDLSENMLERAKQLAQNDKQRDAIQYVRSDMGTYSEGLTEDSFDLIFSSLAIHYLEDLTPLFERVYRSLKRGSKFVFTTEHPIYSAPSDQQFKKLNNQDGSESTKEIWPLTDYSIEGRRETNWFVNGVVKYHRTIGTLVNLLIATGFTLNRLEEYKPTQDQLKQLPEIFTIELQRPMFLMISVSK